MSSPSGSSLPANAKCRLSGAARRTRFTISTASRFRSRSRSSRTSRQGVWTATMASIRGRRMCGAVRGAGRCALHVDSRPFEREHQVAEECVATVVLVDGEPRHRYPALPNNATAMGYQHRLAETSERMHENQAVAHGDDTVFEIRPLDVAFDRVRQCNPVGKRGRGRAFRVAWHRPDFGSVPGLRAGFRFCRHRSWFRLFRSGRVAFRWCLAESLHDSRTDSQIYLTSGPGSLFAGLMPVSGDSRPTQAGLRPHAHLLNRRLPR